MDTEEPQIGLSIFTNASYKAPFELLNIIKETYNSFCTAFRPIKPIVFYDPMPNVEASEEYYENLIQLFDDVRMSRSLADGHCLSVEAHETPFIFHLEHDWRFVPENIHHSLDEIVSAMEQYKVLHLRFNKRSNRHNKGSDSQLEEWRLNDIPVCVTKFLSNNPHIINRQMFQTCLLPAVRNRDTNIKRDHERRMSQVGYSGMIYGAVAHPQTIVHLEGRGKRPAGAE